MVETLLDEQKFGLRSMTIYFQEHGASINFYFTTKFGLIYKLHSSTCSEKAFYIQIDHLSDVKKMVPPHSGHLRLKICVYSKKITKTPSLSRYGLTAMFS